MFCIIIFNLKKIYIYTILKYTRIFQNIRLQKPAVCSTNPEAGNTFLFLRKKKENVQLLM